MFSDLKIRWTADDCLYTPSSVIEIERWQHLNNAELTNDLRQYFLELNGTKANGDRELFEFYPLEKLKPWNVDEWSLSPGTPVDFISNDWFIFADYMISSWAYAIYLGPNPDFRGNIIGVGWLRYHFITSSFRSFIDLYLPDSPFIYPGPAAPTGSFTSSGQLGKPANRLTHAFKSLTGRFRK